VKRKVSPSFLSQVQVYRSGNKLYYNAYLVDQRDLRWLINFDPFLFNTGGIKFIIEFAYMCRRTWSSMVEWIIYTYINVLDHWIANYNWSPSHCGCVAKALWVCRLAILGMSPRHCGSVAMPFWECRQAILSESSSHSAWVARQFWVGRQTIFECVAKPF